MPLKASKRLPKRFNRPASSITRALARKYSGGSVRTIRRRKERMVRWTRRVKRLAEVIASEFRVWIIILIGIIAFAFVGTLLFAPFFDVHEIQVRRQDPRIDPEEIEQILSPLFNQRLVLVTKNQVAGMLLNAFPEIDRVEIQKDYPSSLRVTVYLEAIAAEIIIDDGDEKPETGSGDSLAGSGAQLYTYVTKNGFVAESPIRLPEAYPKLLITDWGIRPQNRTPILSTQFLQSIFLARHILRRDFGLQSLRITVFLRAKEFHIRTNKATIWFDLRSSLPVQFERFREFLKNLSLDQVKEYIDLRIAGLIIYK